MVSARNFDHPEFFSGIGKTIAFEKSRVTSSSSDRKILPNALDIKGNRPKADMDLLRSAATSILGKFSTLKAPANLSLPIEPPQVEIKELRPISLDDVEHLIEVNSPSIKVASIQVEQAKSLLLSAISSWYPTINLSATGLPQYLEGVQFRNPDYTSNTKLNSQTGKYDPVPYTNSRQWSSSVSIKVQWDIIDPARVPQIAAARDTFEKAKASYVITLRDLRLKALRQYFLLQRADEGVSIGKQSMRSSLVSLRDAKARFKAGVASKLEVLQAESQLARDKQLLTKKLGDQKIARRSLASLLNLPQDITPTAASPAQILGLWQPSLQESIAAAYSFREELDRLLLDISINNSNANKALAASQPLVSLFNTYSASRTQGQAGIAEPSDIEMDDYGWSASNAIGLSASWNLFDGGSARALYRYNKQKAKESELQFALQRDDIRQEVEESFFNLQTASQDISTTSREVLASRESLRLSRLRFQAGVTTQREVVNSQRDLTQAEVRYADSITTYNISLAQLRRRTGLDSIKVCKVKDLPSAKLEADEFIDVPIEPSEFKPTCQVAIPVS